MEDQILVENLGSVVRNNDVLFVYRISVQSQSWVIERTFPAFEKLDGNLRNLPDIHVAAELPKKSIVSRKQSERVVRDRMGKLFTYLQGLVADPKITSTFFLLRFLSFAPSDANAEKQTVKHAPLELPVRKFGFLMKVGEIVKSLKTRFFVLVDNIYYFKEDDHINPIGAVLLDSSVKVAPFKEVQDYPYGISVITQRRHWQLFATSDQEANGWIAAIKAVVEGKAVKPKYQLPPSKRNATAAKEATAPSSEAAKASADAVVPKEEAAATAGPPSTTKDEKAVPKALAPAPTKDLGIVISPEELERRKRAKTLKNRPRYQAVDVPVLSPEARTQALDTFKQALGEKPKEPLGLSVPQLQDALCRSGFDLDLDTAEDIARDICWAATTTPDDEKEDKKKEKKKKKKQKVLGPKLIVSGEGFAQLLAEMKFCYTTAQALPPQHEDDLASEELHEALEALGFEFTKQEVQCLHPLSDPQDSGSIGFEEFVQVFHFVRGHWRAFAATVREISEAETATIDHRIPESAVDKALVSAGHVMSEEEKEEKKEKDKKEDESDEEESDEEDEDAKDTKKDEEKKDGSLIDFGRFIAIAVEKRVLARKLRAESQKMQAPKARKALGTTPKAAFLAACGEDGPSTLGVADLGDVLQRMGPTYAGLPVSVLADIQVAVDPDNSGSITLDAFVIVGTILARAHEKWMGFLKKQPTATSFGTLGILKDVIKDLQQPSESETEKDEDAPDKDDKLPDVPDLLFALEAPADERLAAMVADVDKIDFSDIARVIIYLTALKTLFEKWVDEIEKETVPMLVHTVTLAKIIEQVTLLVHRRVPEKEVVRVAKTFPSIEGVGADTFKLGEFVAVAIELRYRGSAALPLVIEYGADLPPHVVISAFSYSPPPPTGPQFHTSQPVLITAEYIYDPSHTEFGISTLVVYDTEKGKPILPTCLHKENVGCSCARAAPKIQGEVRAIAFAPDGSLFATITFVPTRHASSPEAPSDAMAGGWPAGYQWDQGMISVQVWVTDTQQPLWAVSHFGANPVLRGELRRARHLVDFAWPRADIDWDKIASDRARRPVEAQQQLAKQSCSPDTRDRSRCRIMSLVAGPRVVEIWDVLRGTLVSVLRVKGQDKDLRQTETFDHEAFGVFGFLEARFLPDSTAIHLEGKAYSKPTVVTCDIQSGNVRLFDYLTGKEEQILKHPASAVTSGKSGAIFGAVGPDIKLKMWDSQNFKRKKKMTTPLGAASKQALRTAPGLDASVLAFERFITPEQSKDDEEMDGIWEHALRLPVLAHSPSPTSAQVALCLPDNSVLLWNYDQERKDETSTIPSVLSGFAMREAERIQKAIEKAEKAASATGKRATGPPKVACDISALRVLSKELVPAMDAQQNGTVIPLTPYPSRTRSNSINKDGAEYVQYSATGEYVLVQGVPSAGFAVRVHDANHGATLFSHRNNAVDVKQPSWPPCWPLAQFSPDSRYVAHLEPSWGGHGYLGGRVVANKLPDPETDSHANVHPAVPFDLLAKQHEIIVAIFEDSKSKLANLAKKDLVSLNFVSPIFSASPLMLAVLLDKPNLLKKLIQLGADPSYGRAAVSPVSPDILLPASFHDHMAPVHVACLFRRPKMLSKLAEAGADLNAIWRVQADVEAGLAPLHLSLICDDDSLIELLVNESEGVDIEALDWKGRTPLHLAAIRGNTLAAAKLLARDADGTKTIADGRKLTALHLAVARGDEAMIKTLTSVKLDDGKKKKKKKKKDAAEESAKEKQREGAIHTLVEARDASGKRVVDLNAELVKKCIPAEFLK